MSEQPQTSDAVRPRGGGGAFFLLVLALLAAFAWERDLFDADEGRYASVAVNMAESGDWVTPRLDGMRFMDKPPLVYWVQALPTAVFGRHELWARLPTLLAGALWALFVFLLARAWSGSNRVAWFAGLLAATSAAGMIGARVGPQMDMPLAAAVAGALYAGWCGILASRRRAALGLGLAVGCGLLVKGPLAVAVPAVVAFTWGLAGVAPRRIMRTVFSPWAWGLALVVAAPWYALVERANPGWIEHFIRYEHFGRFATGDHRAFHPFWFYVPVALIYMAPWTPVAWHGLRDAAGGHPWWRRLPGLLTWSPWSKRPYERVLTAAPAVGAAGARVHAGRLAWTWFLVAFLLYSISTRKLLNYLLPAAAPLFVLLGAQLDARLRGGRGMPWGLPALCGLAGLVGGVLLLAGLWFPFATGRLPSTIEAPRYAPLGPYVLAGAGVLIACALAARRLGPTRAGVGALLLGVALGWWALDLGLARIAQVASARRIADALREHAREEDLLVSLKRYPQGLGFYRGPPMWIAGGTLDAPGQREIVNPYARDAWSTKDESLELSMGSGPVRRGGLLTGRLFDALFRVPTGPGGPPHRAILLICRWGEIAPLGAHVVAGPFAGAGRTDLYLVTNRPPAP